MTKMIVHPELKVIEERDDGFSAKWNNLFMIASITKEKDGKEWLHASVSRLDKQLPTWEDLNSLKRLCMDEHSTALQIFPSTSQYVNLWEVLHLFRCLDKDVTPDFRNEQGLI